MLDRNARDKMAVNIRHLIAGIITADHFQEEGAIIACESNDPGVKAVYDEADGLISDIWPWWPYRLRGRRRVSSNTKELMSRTILFLYSDVEYQWPTENISNDSILERIALWACAIFFFLGLMCILISLPLAALCFASSVSIWFWGKKLEKNAIERRLLALNRIGDFSLWPFMSKTDYENAKQSIHLLSGKARKV